MRAWRADLASAAFVKITAVYGQIDENGHFVRKWLARKIPITDKSAKKGTLSVNLNEILTELLERRLL